MGTKTDAAVTAAAPVTPPKGLPATTTQHTQVTLEKRLRLQRQRKKQRREAAKAARRKKAKLNRDGDNEPPSPIDVVLEIWLSGEAVLCHFRTEEGKKSQIADHGTIMGVNYSDRTNPTIDIKFDDDDRTQSNIPLHWIYNPDVNHTGIPSTYNQTGPRQGQNRWSDERRLASQEAQTPAFAVGIVVCICLFFLYLFVRSRKNKKHAVRRCAHVSFDRYEQQRSAERDYEVLGHTSP